jgi:hypothetical protein
LGDEGLALPADRQNPLVVDDHEFTKVFWVLLDFRSVPSPIEVFGRARVNVGCRRRLHDEPLFKIALALTSLPVRLTTW